MSDDLLPWYERELSLLKDAAARFASQHPKIAARLNLGSDAVADPHVERLLQGVAFLNARLHKRIDDDYPELTGGLLDLLYPHYLRPTPSMSIVEMQLDGKQAALVDGHAVPRGTAIDTEPADGEPCRFRTCFDLRLWPLSIVDARLAGPPFRLPLVPPVATAAVLDVVFESFQSQARIGDMPLGSVRLYLNTGAGTLLFKLYEYLLTRCIGVVVSAGPADPRPVLLPGNRIVAAGFDRSESAIPDDPRSFPGYRLLSEFFALPQKFMFVDVLGLTPAVLASIGPRMHLSFLLSATDRELERIVGTTAVRVGCTPIVNLFDQRLDPVRISGTRTDYPVIPDARRPRAVEIHSIESVLASGPGERPTRVSPIYSAGAATMSGNDARRRLRWSAVRRLVEDERPDGGFDRAGDTWISLLDERGGPADVSNLVLHIRAVCTNRNMPDKLPFAVGRPRLHLEDGQGPVERISCLVRPTRALRHRAGRGDAWRIVSHLSLNHLSLVDVGDGRAAAALRDILALYLHDDLEDFAQKQRWIQGIVGVQGRRVAARVGGTYGGVAQGIEVTLQLDEERFSDHTAYLLASLVDRFLGAWVSINSFSRMVATSRQQESRREQWRWPPRAGSRTLV
jgi:type VI secretion system protein ImpG